VLFGPEQLAGIDLDSDEAVARFFELNPWAKPTLQTRGLRGRTLHLRMVGEYPKELRKFSCGEWRGGGGYTVIDGRHPSGVNYQIVVVGQIVEIEWGAIKWPPEWNLSFAKPETLNRNPIVFNVPADESDLDKRIRAYLAKIPPGIQGQHGSDPMLKAATALVVGFNKGIDGARPYLQLYGATCVPPWTNEKEVEHKLREAARNLRNLPLGYLLNSDKEQKETPHAQTAPSRPNRPTEETASEEKDERPELLMPIGSVEYTETAKTLFPVLAERERYFVYGQLIMEMGVGALLKDKQHHDALVPLEADALRSRIEQDFRCMAWREKHGQKVKLPARCVHDTANVLLKTDEAFALLPPLRTLSACPILAGEPKQLKILGAGYHARDGGIYVQGGEVKLPETVKVARDLLLGLFVDYQFVSQSDKGRAAAFFISPALRAGQLLGEGTDFPLDLSEADRSQAGKTIRLKMVHAIYGETPYIITNREGGVGSIDESISSALIAAKPFIMIENYRGRIDSQILESCLRGIGCVGARIPHRGERQVPVGHINWQLSSNGIDSPLDFANRTIISRIQKQEPNHQFYNWPAGSVIAQIKADQAKYLGAVFKLVLEWDSRGRPRTTENRHDFREWVQALDWIVQNLLELPPLLDGHSEELLRISSPALSWLRQVALSLERLHRLEESFLPSEVAQICNDAGIPLSKGDRVLSPEQQTMIAGRMLNHIFSEQEEIAIDRFSIRRETKTIYDPDQRKNFTKHHHWFELRKVGTEADDSEKFPF
jgi:hypothetical protein